MDLIPYPRGHDLLATLSLISTCNLSGRTVSIGLHEKTIPKSYLEWKTIDADSLDTFLVSRLSVQYVPRSSKELR